VNNTDDAAITKLPAENWQEFQLRQAHAQQEMKTAVSGFGSQATGWNLSLGNTSKALILVTPDCI
jgi:hypothetical protein